ncbi:ParB/RepB/Spo0J family partition protein [Sneathiella litorea]|uniref:ParB/RepB/Spo0J family partition protein n=1 Tax=Sneathiella litorea TaxID=2606216 RepID=A0A6L8W6F4_9PROT|nr:ParB/RepB/Spo0J family partition protein [Sneathiella litorea]MZR29797.1 ParB/RepB/Spo0J family partition protein [Sneathiella litorea]
MSDDTSKKKLGRGLSALLGDDSATDYADLDKVRSTKEVPVEQLRANEYQPRLDWDLEALESLAASIAEKGVLQPILVRRNPGSYSEYEIVAGERRWRAAQKAQLHTVPVIIKELTDAESMEIALIENIQREDLSSIEEAEAYKRLMAEFDHTQESLSQHVGKSRTHVANMMRLLTLPESVQTMVREGRLSSGAARTLINHENAEKLAKKIVDEGLSVRAAEKLAKGKSTEQREGGEKPRASSARKVEKSPDVRELEDDLTRAVGMDVLIDHFSDGRGTVTIHYENLDQLDEACRRLTREPLPSLNEEPAEDPIEEDDDLSDEFEALDNAPEDTPEVAVSESTKESPKDEPKYDYDDEIKDALGNALKE